MLYFLYMPAQLLVTLSAYILNPIIVLFADKDGWLPKWLSWYQTFDQSLDNTQEWVEEKWPSVAFKPSDSKIVHMIKRYCQRVCWVYRNCAYGFAYYVCGFDTDSGKLNYKGDCPFDDDLHTSKIFVWEKGKHFWNAHWCFRMNLAYFNNDIHNGYLRVYLGWKMVGKVENPRETSERCMLAMHINPFRNFSGVFKYIFHRN